MDQKLGEIYLPMQDQNVALEYWKAQVKPLQQEVDRLRVALKLVRSVVDVTIKEAIGHEEPTDHES